MISAQRCSSLCLLSASAVFTTPRRPPREGRGEGGNAMIYYPTIFVTLSLYQTATKTKHKIDRQMRFLFLELVDALGRHLGRAITIKPFVGTCTARLRVQG